MSRGIRLHPEHGVNPSLGVCFWCGDDDGTVLLLGHNKGKEAPRRTCVSYDPCETCKKNWELGVVLIQATSNPSDNRPEIQPGVYPTGTWAVMKADAVRRIFDDVSAESAIKHGRALIEVTAWQLIGLDEAPAEGEVS